MLKHLQQISQLASLQRLAAQPPAAVPPVQPLVQQPLVQQPVVQQPVVQQPLVQQAHATQPLATQAHPAFPSVEQLLAQQPLATQVQLPALKQALAKSIPDVPKASEQDPTDTEAVNLLPRAAQLAGPTDPPQSQHTLSEASQNVPMPLPAASQQTDVPPKTAEAQEQPHLLSKAWQGVLSVLPFSGSNSPPQQGAAAEPLPQTLTKSEQIMPEAENGNLMREGEREHTSNIYNAQPVVETQSEAILPAKVKKHVPMEHASSTPDLLPAAEKKVDKKVPMAMPLKESHTQEVPVGDAVSMMMKMLNNEAPSPQEEVEKTVPTGVSLKTEARNAKSQAPPPHSQDVGTKLHPSSGQMSLSQHEAPADAISQLFNRLEGKSPDKVDKHAPATVPEDHALRGAKAPQQEKKDASDLDTSDVLAKLMNVLDDGSASLAEDHKDTAEVEKQTPQKPDTTDPLSKLLNRLHESDSASLVEDDQKDAQAQKKIPQDASEEQAAPEKPLEQKAVRVDNTASMLIDLLHDRAPAEDKKEDNKVSVTISPDGMAKDSQKMVRDRKA